MYGRHYPLIKTHVQAYLSVIGSISHNIIHQTCEYVRDSMDSITEGPILGIRQGRVLTSLTGFVYVCSDNGIYSIQNTQLVGAWGFLEMDVQFLDKT